MDNHEVVAAVTAVRNCWAMYGHSMTDLQVEAWIDVLQPYSLAQIKQGIADHLADGDGGRFKPMPAHVIAMINKRQPQRMTADEAWGIACRQNDERATVLSCTWIDYAMNACQAILDNGDEVGARRCFIEAFNRIAASGEPNKMRVSLGHDPAERTEFINAQVAAGYITAEHAEILLPAPAPTQAGVAIAGLLTGAAGKPSPDNRARFRELAEALAAKAKAEDDEKRKQLEQFAARKEQATSAIEAMQAGAA